MKSKWDIYKIQDICADEDGAISIGPFGSRLRSNEYTDTGIPVIRGKNIRDNPGFEGDFAYVSEKKADSLGTSNVYKNELVFPHRGAIGKVGIVNDQNRYVLSSSLMKLKCNQEFINPRYVYYFFKSHLGRHELLKNSSQVGTPGIGQPLTSLKDIDIPIPPKSYQDMVDHYLTTLDQKIYLNQQTNETLEAMAQAIFKSWFVDFDPVRAKIKAKSAGRDPNRAAMSAIAGVSLEQDWDEIESALQHKLDRMSEAQCTQLHQTAELFPEELVDSEIGVMPKGWGYSTIGKEFDIVNGQSPPGSSYNEEGEGAPFYQGRTDFGFRFPSQRVYCTQPKRFAKKGDTLLSVRAPVGDLNIAIEDCCIGRGLASLRHESGSTSYTYYAMKQVQAQIEAYEATGTVFGSINQKQLKALDTIAPDKKIINEFHRITDPIDSKIMNQVFMNRELSELRDTLLPKLISGEVGV